MTITKQSWLRRCLSALTATAIVASFCAANTFDVKAQTKSYPEGSREVRRLAAPIEDGVYMASVELMNANSTGSASMGNAALRGSSSFLQKNPDDTEYRSLVVVEDGQATALLEFMPMGYIGQYGFMMELESVTAEVLTKYGYPDDNYCTYTPADVIAEHRTQQGEVVYDPYNNPDSASVYDGSNPATMTRPAGYGHQEDRLIDIADEPYQHILALDVTPITSADTEGNLAIPEKPEDFNVTHAAYVHVFVPVMFSISPSSGDQYARMQVDWTSVERIDNPENNLTYRLWSARQIEQGDASDESYANLQTAIEEVTTQLENIWPHQQITMNGTGFSAQPMLEQKEFTEEEKAELVKKLNDAISGLASSPDKTALGGLINEAKALSKADYTPESYAQLEKAVRAAEAVNENADASQEEIDDALANLQTAKDALQVADDATKWSNLYEMASNLDESDYTAESWAEFSKLWIDGKYKDYPDSSKLPMVAILKVSFYNSKLADAMAGLVEKPTIETDPNQLADGKYTLKAYMYKTADPTVYSMSNNAINHNVWLEVKDGKYYLTTQFIGMSMYNQFGYLQDLKYFDKGYTIGEYGTPQGTLIDATVLTTQKDSEGNDVIDQYNDADNLYPEMVQFELVEKADGKYVALQVFVPIMESISPELGTQTVYMELDWSKLRIDDGSVEKIEPPVQSPALDAADAATGVKVHADKGVFEEGTRLVVKEITSGDIYDQGKESFAQKKIGDTFVLYDINFTDAKGEAVTPNGYVTYSIPIPEEYNADGIVLMRINDLEDNIGPSTQISGFSIEDEYLVIRYNARTAKPIHFALVDADPYTGADYTEVDEALAKIPADLSVYTDASAAAVENAKDAVVRGKNITEQAAVDAMAAAINDAVAALEKKEADKGEKESLEDGTYSIYGEMVKLNRIDKSMSNDAINHTIKLTVEDGEYYLTMDFHGLAYLNRFGYLAELSYYDNGYSYGEYGTIEGERIPAVVLSTQKNADGSDVYDEFNQAGGSYAGKLYPDQIRFPLVADALADEEGYVPLHVFVPVMEDISAGTGDQDVLLKLDWSTLTKTTEDDPVFQPEEPVEQSPAVDYTDSKTGVKIHADKGVFDEGVQLVVDAITSGADYEAAASALSDVGKKFKLYDVKFLDVDGKEVVPNGTVRISLPVAAGYDSENLAVYRMADGGKVLVKGMIENGYYTVVTKTAGSYAIVEKSSTVTDAENTENVGDGKTTAPQTGDNSNETVYALLALAAAGITGATLVARKRKSEEA